MFLCLNNDHGYSYTHLEFLIFRWYLRLLKLNYWVTNCEVCVTKQGMTHYALRNINCCPSNIFMNKIRMLWNTVWFLLLCATFHAFWSKLKKNTQYKLIRLFYHCIQKYIYAFISKYKIWTFFTLSCLHFHEKWVSIL